MPIAEWESWRHRVLHAESTEERVGIIARAHARLEEVVGTAGYDGDDYSSFFERCEVAANALGVRLPDNLEHSISIRNRAMHPKGGMPADSELIDAFDSYEEAASVLASPTRPAPEKTTTLFGRPIREPRPGQGVRDHPYYHEFMARFGRAPESWRVLEIAAISRADAEERAGLRPEPAAFGLCKKEPSGTPWVPTTGAGIAIWLLHKLMEKETPEQARLREERSRQIEAKKQRQHELQSEANRRFEMEMARDQGLAIGCTIVVVGLVVLLWFISLVNSSITN